MLGPDQDYRAMFSTAQWPQRVSGCDNEMTTGPAAAPTTVTDPVAAPAPATAAAPETTGTESTGAAVSGPCREAEKYMKVT